MKSKRAQLIAAAPEMLEALKNWPGTMADLPELAAWMREVDSSIAKAEGREI